MRMNSYEGKRILALVREGDYAHAGEEEALRRTIEPYRSRLDRLVLDVGCGRGGSAALVRGLGFARVAGIDVEAESIARAREVYPGVELHVADVMAVDEVVAGPVGLFYLLNSFYAFADQAGALAALRRIAAGDADVAIFDYVDRGGYAARPIVRAGGAPFLPRPMRLDAMPGMLRAAGWEPVAIEELHGDYERWYAALVGRFDARRDAIVSIAGDAGYEEARGSYVALLEAVRRGDLGGAIVRARAA
jgi:SAM-dependent methyltransferase